MQGFEVDWKTIVSSILTVSIILPVLGQVKVNDYLEDEYVESDINWSLSGFTIAMKSFCCYSVGR